MLAKLAILLHGKLLAVAVASVVLIGGGTAVTVAATSGAIPALHGAHTSTGASQNNTNDDHGGDNATHTPTANNQNGDQHELIGVVSKLGASSFELTSTTGAPLIVTVSAQTRFHDELKSLADLKIGGAVEVKGTLQADGSFAATDVEVIDNANDNDNNDDNGDDNGANQAAHDLHGAVASVASDSFVITVTSSEDNTKVGASVTVTVSAATTFKDLSGLSALKTGDTVEVKGAFQADGSLAATSVERNSSGQSGSGGGESGHSGSGHDGSDD